MKTTSSTRRAAGFVSYMMVLVTSAILTLLMVAAYRGAMSAHAVTSQVQLRVDYSEKEEAILRSIVALTPNRAIRAMQSGSDVTGIREALTWQSIFTESLVLANTGRSIPDGSNGTVNLLSSLNIPSLRIANSGDNSGLTSPAKIFTAISNETGYISAGINRSLGSGYPPPLTGSDSTTNTRDIIYPIVSNSMTYGSLAASGVGLSVSSYPNVNLVKYPQINFGYANPGDNFVAKRNWWAFSVDAAGNDAAKTYLARSKRNFVLSIYEIPSQLAISASSFMSLGQYSSGSAWQNVTISGGVFAGKAEVLGTTAITALASRRGMALSSGTTLGGQSFSNSPFTPGVREAYQITSGAFFPASLASESGRSAFIPISRGSAFFNRFDPVENDPIELSGALNHVGSNVLSNTTWNNYSIGAQQCAMRLDLTGVTSNTNATPTMLRFQYYLASGSRASMSIPLNSAVLTSLPAGYVKICTEDQSYTFSSTVPVDIAYGASGGFTFLQGVTGTIKFANNNNGGPFADPLVGVTKGGYWRPRSPFEIKTAGTQTCMAVYPERMASFLATIGAAVVGPVAGVAPVANYTYNNSLVVNVDYSVTGLNSTNWKPSIPCRMYQANPIYAYDNDYGVILKECANLSSFTKGFSLVTNLRLYIGDDFNTSVGTPPPGYTPSGTFYPPCSLFAPEKRYGVDVDPFAVVLAGQVGSLASDTVSTAVRPLDSKNMSGNALSSGQITVNLKPIVHPADLPPITMMNWLAVLEERRKEYY